MRHKTNWNSDIHLRGVDRAVELNRSSYVSGHQKTNRKIPPVCEKCPPRQESATNTRNKNDFLTVVLLSKFSAILGDFIPHVSATSAQMSQCANPLNNAWTQNLHPACCPWSGFWSMAVFKQIQILKLFETVLNCLKQHCFKQRHLAVVKTTVAR
jgi:hypothetical protein